MNPETVNITNEKKNKKIEETIQNMTLMSDLMVKSVFEDPECIEYLVKTLMKDDKLVIKSFQTQYNIPSLRKHSVILDIFAVLGNGNVVNIEIQLDLDKAEPRRVRHYSSMVDNVLLPKNEDYKNLPEKFVFMVTKEDYFGLGRQVYKFENIMEEDGKVILRLNDGSHIFYVSADIQDDSELGRLLHDLCCKNPEDMFNSTLAERLDFFKNNPKGRKVMYSELKDLMVEEREEGREEAAREIAAAFIIDGRISLQDIARMTKIPLEEIESLAEELRGE